MSRFAGGRLVGVATVLLGGAVAVAVACSSSQPPRPAPLPEPAVCAMPVQRVAEGAVPALRANQWASLLLQGFQPGIAAGNARDCTGRAVEWREPTMRCHEPAELGTVLPQRPVTEDDVVVQRLQGNLRLVWVMTDRFTNGEAIGPIALAEFQGERVAVRATGTLRTYPRRARLRLETISNRRVLIGEGELCTEENNPLSCHRQARLLLLRGDRFHAEPLRSATGRCIGPARFEFAKEDAITLRDTGWRRGFTLSAALLYRSNGIQIHENVLVQDTDPARPQVPPRVFRRAGQDRAIYVLNDTFVASDPSLWSRVLNDQARTNTPRDAGTDVPDAPDGEVDEVTGDFFDGGVN
jgi:hypothetical protein